MIIQRLRDFILTYPGLAQGSQIQVLPFSPNVTEGNGLSYTGLGTPVFKNYVLGAAAVTYRESYSLDVLRDLIDPIENEAVTEFIRDLEKWIVRQSVLGKAPRFGSPDFQERMWAQGGALYMVNRDAQSPFAAYRTNIIIEYQEYYDESEE